MVTSLISGCFLIKYYNEKYHGVHETNFTFTGDYSISSEVSDENIYYTSKCYSTSQFGDCYYKCYEADVYQSAVDYAINYCISNTTLVGYISTDTTNNRCWTSNPNDEIHDTLLTFRITLGYLLMSAIIWSLIAFVDDIKSKLRKNEINEPLNNLLDKEDVNAEV